MKLVESILTRNPCYEEQAVAGVGDDEVWEDGMGMAAGTDKPHDTETVADRGTAYEVHQGAVIIGMDLAGPLYSTVGAGLQLRAEPTHEKIKQGF